jgi:drug/metabolite transporter (DMT)-like permease
VANAVEVKGILTTANNANAGTWRLAVLSLTVIWSTNFAFIKEIFLAVPDLDPSLYCLVRFGIASIVLLPTYINALGNVQLVKDSAFIGLWVMLGYLGQSLGLKLGSTADKSAFISSLVVVWVAVLPFLAKKLTGSDTFLGTRIKPPVWSTVVLAVCGIAVLELGSTFSLSSATASASTVGQLGSTFSLSSATASASTVGQQPNFGDVFSLLQPIGFGTSYLLIERMMKSPTHESNVLRARQATGLRVFTLALLSLAWACASGSLGDSEQLVNVLNSPEALAALLYLGCVTTAGGLWLQTLALRHVTASDASIILSSEPVWAALFASALLGEAVTLSDCIGGGMIISACVANEYISREAKEEEVHDA